MTKASHVLVFLLLACVHANAWSYDKEMAAHFAKLFSKVEGANAGKALHFISPETFVRDLKAGKDMLAIDIRTPAEMDLLGLKIPNSLSIPVNELFENRNLERIPTDKAVVIICKSGARALAATTSLRHLGFNNAFILQGGMQGLSTYYGTGQAYDEAGN